ncbi:hypothetical protein [Ruminococcus flavefaciens]|uniref:hypothetical protein n=1 Tax=Ruminococcus flavefaciens TaxID=1265 RepID=UPI0026F073B3|nr:hypothetical protein [Ruminococcus flavefaciens]
MDFEEEYKQNRTQMKKIKKEDTVILIVFAANVVMSLWMLFAFLMTFNKTALLTVVLGLAASAVGFLSAYRKDSALAIAAGVLLFAEISALFFSDGISLLGILEICVFGWFAARNFMNIKKYRWLEQQDGFPQFEPKLKEYDMDRVQRDIKDPYAHKMEERQSNSSVSMEEL